MDRVGWGWNRGGMEGLTLAGIRGAPSLSLEVRWATRSGSRCQEAVAATNGNGAARSRGICVRAAE